MQFHLPRVVMCALMVAVMTIDVPGLENALRAESKGSAPGLISATSQHPARPPLVVAYYVEENLDAWTTFLTQGHRLSWIITTNYNLVDSSGGLQGTHDPAVVEVAHRLGNSVQFRVANFAGGDFNRDIAHAVLTQPASRTQALANILGVLDAYDYDGINLDFENVPPSDRAALTEFTTELSDSVRSRGKTLSIAVPSKISDQPDNDWSGAFDLAALGRVSDAIIVMTYDEHWSTSAPGPIAALPWVEAVVQYVAGEVGPEKLLLGVAFYGYDWPKRGSARGITMREAVRGANQAGARIMWDTEGQVPYYKTAGRTVYFENAASISRKLTLATRQKLAGVAAWRLGHELPEVWDVLAMYQTNPDGLESRKLTRQSPSESRPSTMLPELIQLPLAPK